MYLFERGLEIRPLLEFHLLVIVATLFSFNKLLITYFVIYKSVNTTICENGTAQFTFYLFMRLSILIYMRAAFHIVFMCNAKSFARAFLIVFFSSFSSLFLNGLTKTCCVFFSYFYFRSVWPILVLLTWYTMCFQAISFR